jgi:hypothetical protein
VSAAGPAAELRTHSLPLSPRVLVWVPAAALTLALLLSFFPWVGAYPGGYRVFSQNAWRAGVGSVDAPATVVPQEILDAGAKIQKDLTPANLLLLMYAILLVVTVVLAWLERALPSQLDSDAVHRRLGWLPAVWPYLTPALLGWSALLLVLILYQSWRGFGLETAVQRYAAARHDSEMKAAETNAKRQVVEIEIGMDAAKFDLATTTVFDIVVAAHVIAVLALVGRRWLENRGAKPPPRIALQY